MKHCMIKFTDEFRTNILILINITFALYLIIRFLRYRHQQIIDVFEIFIVFWCISGLITKKYNRNHVHHHFDGHYSLIFREYHFSVEFLILRYWNKMKFNDVLRITDHYFWKRWYVRQITWSSNSTFKYQFQIVQSFHLFSVPYHELHVYIWN